MVKRRSRRQSRRRSRRQSRRRSRRQSRRQSRRPRKSLKGGDQDLQDEIRTAAAPARPQPRRAITPPRARRTPAGRREPLYPRLDNLLNDPVVNVRRPAGVRRPSATAVTAAQRERMEGLQARLDAKNRELQKKKALLTEMRDNQKTAVTNKFRDVD